MSIISLMSERFRAHAKIRNTISMRFHFLYPSIKSAIHIWLRLEAGVGVR